MTRRTRVRRRNGRKTRKQCGGAKTAPRPNLKTRLKSRPEPVLTKPTPLVPNLYGPVYTYMQQMPIYMISAHGSVFTTYAEAESAPLTGLPEIKEVNYPGPISVGFPVVRIPESTYILNLTGGGEYCIALPDLTQTMINSITDIRNFFLLDDKRDVILPPEPKHPLLYSSYRATNTNYPNMLLSLDPPDDQTGVFELTKMKTFATDKTNAAAIIIPESSPKKKWFLNEIIEAVYAKRGDRRGIFIIAACSSAGKAQANIAGPVAALDLASNMIRHADLIYSSQVPVLSAKILQDSTPRDPGYNTAPAVLALETAAGWAKAEGRHPEDMFNSADPSLFHSAAGGAPNVAAIAGLRPRHHPPN